MTWVYSVRSRDSNSICSSWAAPRMPPKGFLISWARLRMSSLLAWAWSISRSSRSWRACCSWGSSSAMNSPSRPPGANTTCTGMGSSCRRLRLASYRTAANPCSCTRLRASAKAWGSCIQSCSATPFRLRRDKPITSSSAVLAKRTAPRPSTTATKVASQSSASRLDACWA